VQQCLASSAEPTRLDPESSAIRQRTPPAVNPKTDGKAPADVWLLRYRKSTGQLCQARATTLQIVQRLKEGRLPAGVEACRRKEDGFRPLAQFVEFRALLLHRRPARKGVKAAPPPSTSPWHRRRLALLWVGGAAGLAAILGLLYRFLISG
jgi:hypothetical protein